jgi:hypothetical protein
MANAEQLTIDIEPGNPSWRQIFITFMIWIIVGVFTSFLIFIILVLVWGMIQEAISNRISWAIWANPLLPLVLVIIAFLSTFIGSIIVAGIYNLIYTDTYYDMTKMFSLVLTSNIILFIFFIPLYLLFSGSIDELFMILAFHIMFSVFVAHTAIQMTTNPNYCSVHLLWSAFGLVVAIVVFGIFYKTLDVNQWNTAHLLLALPPVLIYATLPLFHGMWEKLYYKFYASGNNFFYIPSLSEVIQDESEYEDVYVENTETKES